MTEGVWEHRRPVGEMTHNRTHRGTNKHTATYTHTDALGYNNKSKNTLWSLFFFSELPHHCLRSIKKESQIVWMCLCLSQFLLACVCLCVTAPESVDWSVCVCACGSESVLQHFPSHSCFKHPSPPNPLSGSVYHPFIQLFRQTSKKLVRISIICFSVLSKKWKRRLFFDLLLECCFLFSFIYSSFVKYELFSAARRVTLRTLDMTVEKNVHNISVAMFIGTINMITCCQGRMTQLEIR